MKNESKFWILFGKISAVLFTIGSVITIYIQLFPTTSQLTVFGSHNKFALPVDYVEAISLWNKKISADTISNIIKEYDLVNKTNISEEYGLSSILQDKLRCPNKKLEIYDNYYGGHYYFKVINEGEMKSNDIMFHSDLEGIALLTYEDDKQTIIEFNKQLKIRDLRPLEQVDISIWSTRYYDYYAEDDFRITDSNGSGDFSFPSYVTGFAKFVANNLFILTMSFIIILVIMFGIFMESYTNSKSVSE